MLRAGSDDHTMFNECISAFRVDKENPYDIYPTDLYSGKSYSYILTSFHITTPWQLPNCTVHPSKRHILPGGSSAFICRIDNPEWCVTRNSHLYGIALSSVISFVTGRLCKAARDDHLGSFADLTEIDLQSLSLLFPVQTAGGGRTETRLSQKTLNTHNKEVDLTIRRLLEIPHKQYLVIMQAMRLVHLSLANEKDDFGLAYLLVISAIESIAQVAIKLDKNALKHEKEDHWNSLAQNNTDFAELLKEYKSSRSKNKLLKERYITFINTFSPKNEWHNILESPMQELENLLKEHDSNCDTTHLTQKHWNDKYPQDLDSSEIEKIISDSYTHRSCYVHRGEQPPHQVATSYTRFFQTFREPNKAEKLLPNYELLLAIARHSISKWMGTIKSQIKIDR